MPSPSGCRFSDERVGASAAFVGGSDEITLGYKFKSCHSDQKKPSTFVDGFFCVARLEDELQEDRARPLPVVDEGRAIVEKNAEHHEETR